MNFKTTLVLVVLLVGVVGAFLLRAGDRGTLSDAPAPEALISGRGFDAITLRGEGPPLSLRNEGGRWWQVEPVRFPVATEAMDSLINAALALTPRETITPALTTADLERGAPTLSSLGLDPPLATVAYVSDEGEQTLELGNTTVAGTAYIRRAGEQAVYVVDGALHRALLTPSPRAWRPKVLPTLPAQRVSRIALQRKGENLLLQRTAEGWSLGENGGQRADTEKAAALASVLDGVSVLNYVDDDAASLSRYGLDRPTARLTLSDTEGKQQTLRIGSDADLDGRSVYASWSDTDEASPVVFTLPATVGQALAVTVNALRDARVVTALPGSVRGQRVNRVGRDTLELATRPDDQGYAFIEPKPGYAPDTALAQAWLQILPQARAMGYAHVPGEAQAPLAIIELVLAGDRAEFVRLFEHRDGREGTLLAVRASESIAAVLPADTLAPLLAPLITLRDRTLPPPDELTTIRLTRDDGTEFRFSLQDGNTPWVLDGAGNDWERQPFAELMAWIQKPHVEQWTPLADLPRGPMVRISMAGDQAAYVVNAEQGLGQRTDLPGVFRLSAAVMNLLTAEYRDRQIVSVPVADVDAVVLTRGGVSRRIERGPDGRYRLGSDGEVDQAVAGRLFNTLAGLRSERLLTAQQARLKPEAAALRIELRRGDGPHVMLDAWSQQANDGRLWLVRPADQTLFHVLPAETAETIHAAAP